MVSSSLLSPSSMELQVSTPPVISFDHNYSKAGTQITVIEDSTAEVTVPFPLQAKTSADEHSAALSNNCNSSFHNNAQNCGTDHKPCATDIGDMLCDLDDLDFSLSDFAMDSDADAVFSFQDYIIDSSTTFSGFCASSSDSADHQRSDNVSSGEACSTPPLFPLISSSSSAVTNSTPSPYHRVAEGCVLSPSETTTSTINASSNLKTSQTESVSCGPTIPTKVCSCLGSEADGVPVCVYSSCQRDSTTVSSSTFTSYQRENKSGMTLKPGDYLPPLYIDTSHCHEVLSPASSHVLSKSDNFSKAGNLGSTFKTLAKDDNKDNVFRFPPTPTAPCNNDSRQDNTDTLSPLATPASQGDSSFNVSQKQLGFQQSVDRSFTETSSDDDDNNEAIDELDLESISDLERYLASAGLDLRSAEAPSLESNPPISLGISPPKTNNTTMKITEGYGGKTDSEPPSLYGLRLSIFDDFSERLESDEFMLGLRDNSGVRKDSTYSPTQYHHHCHHPSTRDTFSWLEKPALVSAPQDFFATSTSSTTSSPCHSPALQSSQATLQGSQMEWSSKEELNILDLFSDENAQFFLNSDSAICQMDESQFL